MCVEDPDVMCVEDPDVQYIRRRDSEYLTQAQGKCHKEYIFFQVIIITVHLAEPQ